MLLNAIITYILLLLLPGNGAGDPPPAEDEIQKRRAELQSLRQQITDFEERLREQQQQEIATLELLDTYDKKGTLVRTLLTKLRMGEQSIQKKIEATRKEIKRLGEQLLFLKAHYANYVSSVYKSGRIHDIDLLFSSKSVNQFYVRAEYLKRFSEQRRADAERVKAKKQQIEETQAQLQSELAEERRLIAEKGTEEDRLAMLVSERRDILFQIRKDKKTAQREMQRRLAAAKELENLIEHLIEVERVRKEREAEEIRKGTLPQPPAVEGIFESKRGKLRWPVAEGSVVAKFGNQIHATLRTVTRNTGIDIAVKAGSPVTAVADGDVSTITWLPSFGNVVIVDHYNGYRTVSTHLSEILVVEGQKLKEGDLIGQSGEALDGPRLHFEIWKDREKQNPELWLATQ